MTDSQPSRRSVLGLLGLAPVAAGGLYLAGPANAETARTRVPDGLRPGGELDRLIADLAARDEFSGSVLLTHRDRTVLARSHGMADKENAVPNGPDTRFALASVTKLFTATAIVQLAQQGKVSYGAKVGAYLTGFPAAIADAVTVHQLLTHTSGLGDYHGEPGYAEASAGWTSREQVMVGDTDFIRRTVPAFPPGSGFSYSNSGYHLLGEIVAAASGMSYYDYVGQHVFAAAGMRSTGFVTRPEWRADRRIAHPYHQDPQGRWEEGFDGFEFVGTPAGDAMSTCADLDRFARALWRAGLADPGHTALMLSGKVPPPPPQGGLTPPPAGTPRRTTFQCYGPIGTLTGGRWSFSHGGGNPAGANTSVELFPDRDWVVVILGNYANGTTLSIAELARTLITAT